MVNVVMNVFLLSLAGAMDKFEEAGAGRFGQTNITPSPLYTSGISDLSTSDDTFQYSNMDKWTAVQDVKKKLNSELKCLLEEAEVCRKNYPNLSNHTFGLKLYGFLLDELAGTPNKTSIFYCSINKRLVDNVRKKIHQLENFQKNFVPSPINDSAEYPGQEQQRNSPKETRSHPPRREDFKGGVENFDLKSEDEWKAKVPYMSHIYLGSSLFPMITEESRVLVNGHTTMRSAVSSKDNEYRKKETVARVYQLLTPFRWNKNIPRNSSHSRRSLRSVNEKPGKLSAGVNNYVFHSLAQSEGSTGRKMAIGSPATAAFLKDGDVLHKAYFFFSNSVGDRVKKMFSKIFGEKK